MDTEPNPELLNRQPRWFKPALRRCIVGSVLFIPIGVACLAYYLGPSAPRAKWKVPLTSATSNARQIGLALFNFQAEYGSYPNASTAADVTIENPAHSLILTGKSSNAPLLL